MVATAAIFVAKWLWVGVQALFHAAKVAAAWFIALGPVGWVIATVIALVILIIANWDKISAWTKKAWDIVWTWIKDTWQKIKSKTTEVASNIWSTVKQKFSDIVSAVKEKMNQVWNGIKEIWNQVMNFFRSIDLFEIGANIIEGLVNGVKSMASSLVNGVKGVVNGAIEGAKALLGINSPSRLFKSFGVYTGEGYIIGVNKMGNKVANAASNMAAAASNAFTPQIANMQATASLSAVVKPSDIKALKHSFSADVADMETPDPTINVYNEWDGEKVVSYVERGNAKRTRITDGFYGK
jgi:phage-related protein